MKESLQEKTRQVFKLLNKLHADAHIELKFKTPLQLLVATVLSAQCTDVRVNQITRHLFKRFRTAQSYVDARASEIETFIRSAGFFRQKAKSIQGAARLLVEKHGGKVPQTMEELVQLPGVGRKTANVILGNAFNIPGLPVDTHVTRVANRIGLTKQKDPVKLETELCAMLPSKWWTQFSHVLIFHGRRVCKARRPACEHCTVTFLCNYFKTLQRENHVRT